MKVLDNLKAIFSCQKYSHLCSKKFDNKLSLTEKIRYLSHHLMCFTCRRFSRQLNSIDKACHLLNLEEQLKDKRLSEDAKSKIQAAIDNEKNT